MEECLNMSTAIVNYISTLNWSFVLRKLIFIRTIVSMEECLNMSTAIGIRKGGMNISTCNLIYWSFVLPTLCFGCEVWFIKKKDNDI